MDTQTFANQKSTVAIAPQKTRITGEELFRVPHVEPSELVNGKIVTQMPASHLHGFIKNTTASLLTLFIHEYKSGCVLTGGVGIYTKRDPDTVRAADVVYISHEQLAQAQEEGFLDVAPELVVEIMSPTNTWTEAQEKLTEYFTIGVQMVWVVDPQLEQVHVYYSLEQFKLLHKQDELTGEEVLPGFSVALTEIFDAE